MIETVMLVALGFLLGLLLALFLAPPLWRRAVRLTTRRLEATLPMSISDIRADKDHLRAGFAVQIRQAEIALEKAKEKSARLLVDANKRRVAMTTLEQSIKDKTARIGEMQNANRVLEQTIKKRLPELEGLLREANGTISQQEDRFASLNAAYAAETDALLQSRQGSRQQTEEIESLRLALEGPGLQKAGVRRKVGALASEDAVKDNQRLTAEVSRLREQLTQLQIAEVNETAQLKIELRALADRLVDAATAEGNRAADSVLLLTQPVSVPLRKPGDGAPPITLLSPMPEPEPDQAAESEPAPEPQAIAEAEPVADDQQVPVPPPNAQAATPQEPASEPAVSEPPAEGAAPETAPDDAAATHADAVDTAASAPSDELDGAAPEPGETGDQPTELERRRREKHRRKGRGLDRRSTLADRLRGIGAEKV